MKTKIVLLATGIFLIACHQNKTTKDSIEIKVDSIKFIPKSMYSPDSLDYLIISEAIFQYLTIPPTIGHRYHDYKPDILANRIKEIKSFVINDTTFFDEINKEYVLKKHYEIDSTDIDLINKLFIRNELTCHFDSAALMYLQYHVVKPSKIRSLISLEFGYRKFMEEYGYPSLLISVSIPAFNETKDQALIYVGWSNSLKSGQGGLIWLKKKRDKWISYDLVHLWIS